VQLLDWQGSGSLRGLIAKQIAFNCVPQIDKFQDNGYTKEELKMVWETRKILEDPNIRVNATAVRVPVFLWAFRSGAPGRPRPNYGRRGPRAAFKGSRSGGHGRTPPRGGTHSGY